MSAIDASNVLPSEKKSARPVWAIASLFVFWVVAYWADLKTAIHVWSISEIFHHCFLVMPTAIYLFWTERHHISRLTHPKFTPSYWMLPLLVITTFFGVFAHAGKIAVIGHIAAFTSLSLMIVCVVGLRVAKLFYFPILFVLFSIPIGEELIPLLQDVTADLAVWMLGFVGIPIFNNGLYIEIPAGRFVVAEACSGISFLIVSIVFGSVYSYLGFSSRPKQIAFVIISVAFPILANALRVFGIIIVGHLSNMEHATGADHIVYGAVFFSFVLFCLYLIGSAMGGNLKPEASSDEVVPSLAELFDKHTYRAVFILILLLALASVWKVFIDRQVGDATNDVPNLERLGANQFGIESAWQPQFSNAAYHYYSTQRILIEDESVSKRTVLVPELFVAWYPKTHNQVELISRDNRLYRVDNWTSDWRKSIKIPFENRDISATLWRIYSPSGAPRYIAFWYNSELLEHGNKVFIKLSQTLDIVMNGQGSGSVVALSIMESDLNGIEVESALAKVVSQIYPTILEEIGPSKQ